MSQLTFFDRFILPAFLMIAGISMIASIDIYLPAAPFLTVFFNTSEILMQISLMVAPLVASITGLYYGFYTDNNGRRKAFLFSIFIFIIGSLLCAQAKNMDFFLTARFFQATGAGGMNIISIAIIADKFHQKSPELFAQYMAIFSICFPITFAIAPVIGAHLFETFGWQSNFYFLAAFATLQFIFFFFFLKEYHKLPRKKSDFLTMLMNLWLLLKTPNFIRYGFSHGLPVTISIVYVVNSAFLFINQFGYDATQYANIQLIPTFFNLVGSVFTHIYLKKIGVDGCLKVSLRILCVFVFAAGISIFYPIFQGPIAIVTTICIMNLTLSSNITGAGTKAVSVVGQNRGLGLALLGFIRNGLTSLAVVMVAYFVDGTIVSVYIAMIIVSCMVLFLMRQYFLSKF